MGLITETNKVFSKLKKICFLLIFHFVHYILNLYVNCIVMKMYLNEWRLDISYDSLLIHS